MPKTNRKQNIKILKECDIKIRTGFSRSTNLEYDFENRESLSHLVVSGKFQRQFSSITQEIINKDSKSRVYVISGTPGVGKSTFALFLSRFLAKKYIDDLQETFKAQKSAISKEFHQRVDQLQDQGKFLPIFLNGDEGEIEDALLNALMGQVEGLALKEDLLNLTKEDSERSLAIIRSWERDYPETYKEFSKIIDGSFDGGVRSFLPSLKRGYRNSRKVFHSVYTRVTGGATLGGFSQAEVVKLYQEAARLLRKKGYSGIFVIYDEFGKYLERGVRHPGEFDLHFLQDFAEACNASGINQLHLTLLTHLPISQYASNLPPSIQKEWAKVEGRFSQFTFNDNATSSYSLLASAIEEEGALTKKSKKASREVVNLWLEENRRRESLQSLVQNPEAKEILRKCYPLHPSVVGILPLLSEKTAQNERTMFSFLARDEEFSLQWFLKYSWDATSPKCLSPYDLYLYFQPLIAADTGIGGSCRVYLIAQQILNTLKPEQHIEKEIIAILAMSTVINNKRLLRTDELNLVSLLTGIAGRDSVAAGLKELEGTRRILCDKISGEFILFEGASVDLKEEIRKIKQRKLTSQGYVSLLRRNFNTNFVIPKRYNFRVGMTRFCTEHLISVEELGRLTSDDIDYSKEDGRVYYVAPFSRAEISEAHSILENFDRQGSIFVVPNQPLDIETDLLELHAIEQIYSMKEVLTAGITVKKELDHYRDLSRRVIQKSCEWLRSTSHMDASAFYRGKVMETKVVHESKLADIVSDVMEREFTRTPTLNNEMINKRKVSIPIIQGRMRLMHSIPNIGKTNWGITTAGPELSILRSLLKNNNIKVDTENSSRLTLSQKSALKDLFEDFVLQLRLSDSPVTIETLLSRWSKPPFGVRPGLVSLYLCLFSRMTTSPLSIYLEGTFIPVHDTESFENFLKQPKKYSLQMVEMNAEIERYLTRISGIFSKNLRGDTSSKELKTFLNVAKIVSQFYGSIPEFARRASSLSVRQKKLITALDSFKQPEKFFLYTLPDIYTQQNFKDIHRPVLDNFYRDMAEDVDSLVDTYVALLKSLAKSLRSGLLRLYQALGKEIDISETGAPLAKLWKEAMSLLPATVKDFPFNTTTLRFVNRVSQLDANAHNQPIVETLSDALTGASPRFWDEKGRSLFEFNLRQVLNELVQITLFLSDEKKDRRSQITSIAEDGQPQIAELTQAEVSNDRLMKLATEIRDVLSGLTDPEINKVLVHLLLEINKTKEKSLGTGKSMLPGQTWG